MKTSVIKLAKSGLYGCLIQIQQENYFLVVDSTFRAFVGCTGIMRVLDDNRAL